MKYICTILLICGLFVGQAWGQDTDTLVLPDWSSEDNIITITDVDDTTLTDNEQPPFEWSEHINDDGWICLDIEGGGYETCFAHPSAIQTLIAAQTRIAHRNQYVQLENADIRAILERCRDLNRISRDMWEKGTPFYVKSLNLEFDIDEMMGRLE
jgi:hypothetical protein